MSKKHIWVLKHIEAYLAGGLDERQCKRVERHVAECEECARALQSARTVDNKLNALFADVRPQADMEERIVQSLRQTMPARPMPFFAKAGLVALAGMAAALLIALGAGLSVMHEEGRLAFPSADKSPLFQVSIFDDTLSMTDGKRSYFGLLRGNTGVNNLKQMTLSLHEGSESKTPQEMARTFSRNSYTNLMHGTTHHGMNFGLGNGKMADYAGRYKQSQRGQGLNEHFFRSSVDDLSAALRKRIDPTATKDIKFRPAGEGDHDLLLPSTTRSPKLFDGEKKRLDPMITDRAEKLEKGKSAIQRKLSAATFNMRAANPLYSSDGKKLATADSDGGIKLWNVDTGKKDKKLAAHSYFNPAKNPGDSKPGDDAPGESKGDPGKFENNKQGSPKNGEVGKDPKDKGKSGGKAQKQPKKNPPAQNAPKRKIIRSGSIEFEVESFDKSVATINELIDKTPGSFVATTDSDKLANGKMRGTVVVRVPPDKLDDFVQGLRKTLAAQKGELRTQSIGSQDITKKYYDLESRLKAARTMEERLLKIIKDGKGEIKDLLLAEKELGIWRTKIEEHEGEIRYFNNMVALSTLTIHLTERSITSVARVIENERVNAGIEVDDVEKAMRETLKAVEEQKGRITRSELKQHSAGQFNAVLNFEVNHEKAGLVRDRLKQIGNVVRLEVNRVQSAEHGAAVQATAKVKRGDTQFYLNIYNLVNVAPRETVTLKLAVKDVAEAYSKLRKAVDKAEGRVTVAQLNEQDRQNINAQLDFDAMRVHEGTLQLALKEAGQIVSRHVSRAAASDNVTDAKVLFKVQMAASSAIPSRETITLKLAAADVPAVYHKLRQLAQEAGVVLDAQLNENDRRNITANLDFRIRRSEEQELQAELTAAGAALSRNSTRAPESDSVTDTTVRYKIELSSAATIPPRENIILAIEVTKVEHTVAFLTSIVEKSKGRIIGRKYGRERSGVITARVFYDVPYTEMVKVVEEAKKTGQVRYQDLSEDTSAPEGKLALARIDVTLSNASPIVPEDQTLWTHVRDGLARAFALLAMSVTFLIVAIAFVLPWLIVLTGIIWIVRRIWRGGRTRAAAVNVTAAGDKTE